MDWSELDALADELRRTLALGHLRDIPAIDRTNTLTPEQMARIVLADVDHLRSLDEGMLTVDDRSLDQRREEVAATMRRLLSAQRCTC